ncbi:MAG: endolytic transglycosylase MltG [Myxococcota bacterium]
MSGERKGRVLLHLAGLLLAVGLATAIALGGWLHWTLAPIHTAGPPSPVGFDVEPGTSLSAVARRLEAQGLIRSALAMRGWARLRAGRAKMKTGEYELSPTLSTPEILEILASGRVRTHPVVIPEGVRAVDIADRLAAAGLADRERFLALVLDPDSPARFEVDGPTLEGYLYPDTYRFARGLPVEAIARTMVDRFRTVYHELRNRVPTTLSMRELVTLASIVEKETGVPEERPLIAAVFLNRMRLGMRLETDPTVIYGVEDFDGNLRRRHLEDDSNPYNTYRIPGLPPGPIASPGQEAIRAVLEPADTNYLYFVSRNDGTHVFSTSYRDHSRAVARFQKQRRRR